MGASRQPQILDGRKHSIDGKTQALARVPLQLLGRYSANLQPALFCGNEQRMAKVIAVRGMNPRVRGENRRQGALLAARGVDDADGSHGYAAFLQLFGLGPNKILCEAGRDRHISVQTTGGFLDARELDCVIRLLGFKIMIVDQLNACSRQQFRRGRSAAEHDRGCPT